MFGKFCNCAKANAADPPLVAADLIHAVEAKVSDDGKPASTKPATTSSVLAAQGSEKSQEVDDSSVSASNLSFVKRNFHIFTISHGGRVTAALLWAPHEGSVAAVRPSVRPSLCIARRRFRRGDPSLRIARSFRVTEVPLRASQLTGK